MKIMFVISCKQGVPSLIDQEDTGYRQFCRESPTKLSSFNAFHLVNVSPSTDLYGKYGTEEGSSPSELNTTSNTEQMEERNAQYLAGNSDDLKNDEDETRQHQLQKPAQESIPGSVLYAEQ